MAEEADIKFVQNNLPPEAAALGWDDVKITEQLDGGNSAVVTVRDFWAYRVAQTNEFVNITESGSARSMEAVFNHAMGMLQYWDGRVKGENDQNGVVNPRGRIAFHTATRV